MRERMQTENACHNKSCVNGRNAHGSGELRLRVPDKPGKPKDTQHPKTNKD